MFSCLPKPLFSVEVFKTSQILMGVELVVHDHNKFWDFYEWVYSRRIVATQTLTGLCLSYKHLVEEPKKPGLTLHAEFLDNVEPYVPPLHQHFLENWAKVMFGTKFNGSK